MANNDLKRINKQINQLQTELLKQLQTTNIEYIDLYRYVNQLEALKIKKDSIYLSDL